MGAVLGLKSIGDLQAIQKMIDHANKTVETDFQTVQDLAHDVKAIRANLDHTMMGYHTELQPPCKDFADARTAIFTGNSNMPSLANACLEAQGKMKTMLALGFHVAGCDEACTSYKGPAEWAQNNTTLWCDHGPCHSTLRCTKQLEDVIDGRIMKARDAEVLAACNTAGFDMFVSPPNSMINAGQKSGLEALSQCGKMATSSMHPALSAVLALPSWRLEDDYARGESRSSGCSGVPEIAGRKRSGQVGKVFL